MRSRIVYGQRQGSGTGVWIAVGAVAALALVAVILWFDSGEAKRAMPSVAKKIEQANAPYNSIRDLNERGLPWERKMDEIEEARIMSPGGFSGQEPDYLAAKFEAKVYNVVAGEELDRLFYKKPLRSKPEIEAAIEATRKDLLDNYGWRELLGR